MFETTLVVEGDGGPFYGVKIGYSSDAGGRELTSDIPVNLCVVHAQGCTCCMRQSDALCVRLFFAVTSAKDGERYRARFDCDFDAKQLETELLTLLQVYTLGARYNSTAKVKGNDTPLHAGFNLCGGYDGDSEVFLVPLPVLIALKEFFVCGRTPASAGKLL
jgi:hypothetical protein